MVFDLEHDDTTLRIRMDKSGVRIWKRAVGNLDGPRAYDPFIEASWEKMGQAGTCYAGSQSGHFEKGPASGRAGLNYLTKARVRKSRACTEKEVAFDIQPGKPIED